MGTAADDWENLSNLGIFFGMVWTRDVSNLGRFPPTPRLAGGAQPPTDQILAKVPYSEKKSAKKWVFFFKFARNAWDLVEKRQQQN